MTPEQIIELADECGASVYKYQSVARVSIEFGRAALAKFAKLIEAANRAECARVCRNLIANEGTSASISVAKEVSNLCAEAIESMK